MVPIFNGKGDAMNCGAYRGMKLLEHVMKTVQKVLEMKMRLMVKVDDRQFVFMPGKGAIDAVFILKGLKQKYLDEEKKLIMCFVDPEKAFEEGIGVCNEEERYTRGNGESSDEFV